ncbi:glucan-binding protein, partial [Clostridiaceae bacterium]|nr:glucan-binding protein [Clostridiaceae bacterium]
KKISNDKKKIGGKTYFFNEDGEMLSGWYAPNGKDGEVYYLGEEDEGWRAENQWLWLERPTDEDADDNEWSDPDDECKVSCDDEGWYWFGSDGKMFRDASKKKTINGKHYYFNEHGQMLYEWINTKDGNTIDGVVAEEQKATLDSLEEATPSEAQKVKSDTVGDMRYANQVEDGSRTNGWYEIEGSQDARSDGDTDWYFFKDGKAKKADSDDLVEVDDKAVTDDGALVYRARIKCDGKYFCFNELGQMQTGLQLINGYFYYFDDNGYMKTGKVADVEEADDDVYTYYFETKNNGNGRGISTIKDGYLYWNGKRVEADDDYALYWLGGEEIYLVNSKGKVQKTPKKYALDSVSGDDIYVDIKNNRVKSISEEKNGASIDLTVPATVMELAKEEVIWVPHILIYDMALVPVVVPQ